MSLFYNLWEVIHQNGGGCDYVSENIINKASFAHGAMRYNERTYTTLLLPEIETLDLKTAQSLAAFANQGGKIVFIGKQPHKSYSYKNGDADDTEVSKIINDLIKNENVTVYPAPTDNLLQWYRKLQNELGLNP